MQDIALLKLQADEAYKEMVDAIDGVSEHQAWARIECQPGEYLHTEGSILSIVAHVASCKQIYASAAYRGLEIRFRDTVERLEQTWPRWDETKRWLQEAHEYWMDSWAREEDAERPVKRFNGQDWPSWKIISTVSHHDSYHAGQVQVLRSVLAPSEVPPPEETDLWRKYCGEEWAW